MFWLGLFLNLVHVAIPPGSTEKNDRRFLSDLPRPLGLGPPFSGQWNLYAQNLTRRMNCHSNTSRGIPFSTTKYVAD
jgi:hypothetical protein